ncbi:MAG TPA: putative Ig domain-containing protein, partial [Planctomycetaceae bacterium]|nr:putative Ig domain-containing protein [Planctomycetaceae bacterium]
RKWVLPLNLVDSETAKDKLSVKLTGAPEGLTANLQNGQLEWTPQEPLLPGTYPVTVAVTDTGTPPQTTTSSITITVEDDTAVFTYLVGIVAENGERQAWLFDRLQNKKTILRTGDKVEVADINATIEVIDSRAVRLKEKDETFTRLEIGQNLRERRVVPAEAKAATTETTR